jgi:hypothetical protein
VQLELSELLNEVHFSDAFPRGFMDFYKAWAKRKNEYGIFVQFTHRGDTLDRSSVQSPDHSDPVGNYAYPLRYVIDHPSDIWYGHGARYVRVLKDKSRHPVTLSSLSYYRAQQYLTDVGLSRAYDLAGRLFPDKAKGVTAPGKLFMSCVLFDFEKCEISRHRGKYKMEKQATRSSAEQTALLRTMGIDSLEDQANREPTQIVFLTPQSFQVLATYRMADPYHKGRVGVNVTDAPDRLMQKFAAALAAEMGDQLIDHEGKRIWWTKGGREITLEDRDTSLEARMAANNAGRLKFGGKMHKMYKKTGRHEIVARIESERGYFLERLSHTLEDAVKEFRTRWNRESVDNGERYTRARRDAEKEAEQRARWDAQYAKEEAWARDGWADLCTAYARVAAKYDLEPRTLPPLEAILTSTSPNEHATKFPAHRAQQTLNMLSLGREMRGVELNSAVTAAGHALGELNEKVPNDQRHIHRRLLQWAPDPSDY